VVEEDEPLDDAAGWETVHVEHDWYDGPVSGVADVNGHAHYFRRVNDDSQHEGTDEFYVWPAAADAVLLELQNWLRFVAWNERYEAGQATVATHPGVGGVDERYDTVECLLTRHRALPDSARRLSATWKALDGPRYHAAWPLYLVRWTSAAGTASERSRS
jgi:hypothetical protein